MLADASAELLDMATRIGMEHKWIQYAGTWREHFDISAPMRELSIQYGALEVSSREIAAIRANRRNKALGVSNSAVIERHIRDVRSRL